MIGDFEKRSAVARSFWVSPNETLDGTTADHDGSAWSGNALRLEGAGSAARGMRLGSRSRRACAVKGGEKGREGPILGPSALRQPSLAGSVI